MIRLFIKKFIKNYQAANDPVVRAAYGKLSGLIGIGANLILFLLKLCAGLLAGSIAVMSDAFNNLSDMGSSVVSLIGVTAAGRRADEEHPFGHGRVEYIASLIVSFLIILVGFELLRGSFDKIVHYVPSTFSYLTVVVLLFSMVVKLWMFFGNRYIGKAIDSMVVRATAQDSLNDVYATGAVLVSLFVNRFVNLPIDGLMGVVISMLIMISGYKLARDTTTLLLGTPPDPQVVETICNTVLRQEGIEGVHDLLVHDYGPGRRMASIHAEVPANGDIVRVHEIIDRTEKEIERELGVHIVIHMDPICVTSERIEELRQMTLACVHEVNTVFGIHDFRVTDGAQKINLIFDLEVPYSTTPQEREQAVEAIREKLKEKDARFRAVIQVDNKF